MPIRNTTALVIGVNGGIGQATAQLLTSQYQVKALYTVSRDETAPLSSNHQHFALGAVATVAAYLDAFQSIISRIGPVDLVMVCTGLLHSDSITPEKRLQDLDLESMQQVFDVNAHLPLLLIRSLLPNIKRDTIITAVSARVGSIGDNRTGGWYSYRASKAALNMYFKNLAIELKRTKPDSIVALLHPGTTDTALSKPFQKRVPDHKLFTPEQTAGYLLEVVDQLKPDDTGGFFAWDGQSIEW